MDEKWHIHTATGYSVRTESGEIVFEYNAFKKFDSTEYQKWLDYANHVCELHNRFIELRKSVRVGGNEKRIV